MPRKKTPDDSRPISVEQTKGKTARAMRDLVAVHTPRPVMFWPKRIRKANETYPLKLAQQQRDSLIHATRIKNKLRERPKKAGRGTQIVSYTLKELDHLNDVLSWSLEHFASHALVSC